MKIDSEKLKKTIKGFMIVPAIDVIDRAVNKGFEASIRIIELYEKQEDK